MQFRNCIALTASYSRHCVGKIHEDNNLNWLHKINYKSRYHSVLKSSISVYFPRSLRVCSKQASARGFVWNGSDILTLNIHLAQLRWRCLNLNILVNVFHDLHLAQFSCSRNLLKINIKILSRLVSILQARHTA